MKFLGLPDLEAETPSSHALLSSCQQQPCLMFSCFIPESLIGTHPTLLLVTDDIITSLREDQSKDIKTLPAGSILKP